LFFDTGCTTLIRLLLRRSVFAATRLFNFLKSFCLLYNRPALVAALFMKKQKRKSCSFILQVFQNPLLPFNLSINKPITQPHQKGDALPGKGIVAINTYRINTVV
jgi:hypothetical protein